MLEIFRVKRALPFMRNAKPWFVVSVLAVVLSMAAIALRGLNLGIDFTGGTVIEVAYPQSLEVETVRQKLATVDLADAIVQNFGSSREVLIRVPVKPGVTSAQLSETVLAALREREPKVEMKRVEFVGPQVGDELLWDGLLALVELQNGEAAPSYVAGTSNFYVVTRYNWSAYYAMAVIDLSRELRQARTP